MYIYPDWNSPELTDTRRANVSVRIIREVSTSLGLRWVDDAVGHLKEDIGPEDIFHCTYAVFHSRDYWVRYAELFRIDFPRLPLTGNLELFRALAQLGGELVALPLLESPTLDQPMTELIGNRNQEVEKPTWSNDTVWVDKRQTTGLKGVPEEVWNFHIGGYQVPQVAQGPQGPHPLGRRHRQLSQDRRRPERDHPPDAGNRCRHRSARRLARGLRPDHRRGSLAVRR